MSVAPGSRRRLVRSPRLPRAPEVDPAQRRRRLHEHARPALAGGAAGRRPRRMGHAHDADLPARGVRSVPVGARLRGLDRRAARDPAEVWPRSGSSSRRRRATRRTTSSRRGQGVARRRARRDVGPRRVPACERARDHSPAGARCQRARADRPRRGSRALRRRGRAGARPDRAARRPVRQAPGRARHRPEEGGGPARAVRLARGGARRRTVRGGGGGLEAVPANRDDGRLRSPSSPRRNSPGVGGGVFFSRRTRPRRGRRTGGRRYRRPDAPRDGPAAPDRRPPGAARAARRPARAPVRLERGPRSDGGGVAALPHRRAR